MSCVRSTLVDDSDSGERVAILTWSLISGNPAADDENQAKADVLDIASQLDAPCMRTQGSSASGGKCPITGAVSIRNRKSTFDAKLLCCVTDCKAFIKIFIFLFISLWKPTLPSLGCCSNLAVASILAASAYLLIADLTILSYCTGVLMFICVLHACHAAHPTDSAELRMSGSPTNGSDMSDSPRSGSSDAAVGFAIDTKPVDRLVSTDTAPSRRGVEFHHEVTSPVVYNRRSSRASASSKVCLIWTGNLLLEYHENSS